MTGMELDVKLSEIERKMDMSLDALIKEKQKRAPTKLTSGPGRAPGRAPVFAKGKKTGTASNKPQRAPLKVQPTGAKSQGSRPGGGAPRRVTPVQPARQSLAIRAGGVAKKSRAPAVIANRIVQKARSGRVRSTRPAPKIVNIPAGQQAPRQPKTQVSYNLPPRQGGPGRQAPAPKRAPQQLQLAPARGSQQQYRQQPPQRQHLPPQQRNPQRQQVSGRMRPAQSALVQRQVARIQKARQQVAGGAQRQLSQGYGSPQPRGGMQQSRPNHPGLHRTQAGGVRKMRGQTRRAPIYAAPPPARQGGGGNQQQQAPRRQQQGARRGPGGQRPQGQGRPSNNQQQSFKGGRGPRQQQQRAPLYANGGGGNRQGGRNNRRR